MALKKGWEQRRIHENCMGWHFDRWYIKSPAGNFYELFRNNAQGSHITYSTIYLVQDKTKSYDVNKEDKIPPIAMGEHIPNWGWERWKWNRILQEIYKIEESGTYSKTLSDSIENYPECKMLFSSPAKSQRIMAY